MPEERRQAVKGFPQFDDFTFHGQVYRDRRFVTPAERLDAVDVMARYLHGFDYHHCNSTPTTKFDSEGIPTTDLTMEETDGDYGPVSFGSFRDGKCVDVMNFHACRVLEREGGRPGRPNLRYMKCRAVVSLMDLDDGQYAEAQSQFYQWMVQHVFLLAEGPSIEFVAANIAVNERLSSVSQRLAGAVAAIGRDFDQSSDHRGAKDDYGTEPDWFHLNLRSASREDDVVPDEDRRG